MKIVFSFLALLYCATAWGNDGDTFVAQSIEGDELVFSIISESEKTCKVGNGSHAYIEWTNNPLTIPASVNGYTVVAIAPWAFYQSGNSVIHLPNTIKTIEHRAFVQNYYLTEIDIPESVETIEELAFWKCSKLAHVSFHEGLKKIGREAFFGCALTSIDLPQSLIFIEREAFSNTPLATVTVRSSKPIAHDTEYSIFDNYTYMSATLYVPENTKNKFIAYAYKEWRSFWHIKEGEPLFERPTDIAYPEHLGRQYLAYGNPFTINVKFINERITPITSISYVPIIRGVKGEEHTYEFPQPIAANGEPFTLPISLPAYDAPKEVNFVFDIIKINGMPVEYGADIRANTCGTACIFIPVHDHKVLIEDYTNTQCIWALRSNIGLEKVKEKYGDKIIRASIHIDKTMWGDPFSYTPVTPSCQIDDYGNYDPYYGEGSEPLGILDIVEKKLATPHLGKVKILSAQWADAEQTEINIETESTINMSHYPKDKSLFSIIYILVEDGLKGEGSEWEQLNGYAYAGGTIDDPNLQSLTQLPYIISDMVYPDVAVGFYKNELQESFIYGKPQVNTYTLQLSERTQNLCQDKNKLSVIACLQDQDSWLFYDGDLIDADNSPIKAHPSDIIIINQNVAPHDVYDLSGRIIKAAAETLDDLPKGIYIYGGKKIVIGSN